MRGEGGRGEAGSLKSRVEAVHVLQVAERSVYRRQQPTEATLCIEHAWLFAIALPEAFLRGQTH